MLRRLRLLAIRSIAAVVAATEELRKELEAEIRKKRRLRVNANLDITD